MIKILKHNTAKEPIYIALSIDPSFHVLYGDISLGSHNSIGAAIQSVADESSYGVSDFIGDWERLTPPAI